MDYTANSLIAFAACSFVACASEPQKQEPSEPAPAILPSALKTYTGFAGPERVLYDAERDRYLVSNVNGDATARDGNGFISVLAPEGDITELKWIDGLDAPKGLAIAGGTLYVADIDTVRLFDSETGAATGEIPIAGSTYLNGLSATADGKVYLSDSGPPRGTFDGLGTEALYVIENGEPKVLADGQLGRPTSLSATGSGVVVAPFGDNVVYRVDAAGNKRQLTQVPLGGLAGVVQIGSWLYLSSWQAAAIYRGRLGGEFEIALSDQSSPTDIGYDSQRARFLVPHYTDGSVDVYQTR
jgi:hypothetical protein